ncbi:MAG: MBL fold metallo-hydrolase [Clostridia bacterium]|nr:MBL fold metallo-hydrolase [Clostridia bacterium]
MFERRKIENPWEGKIEPFKIIGNVYFVGTFQASAHIIDTGDGLIFIDPGYSNTLYLIVDGIYKLGFKPTDIKYIINTHWHGDHTEATAALRDLSGAKTLLGKDDVEKAKKHFIPDILVGDGYTLTLGNTTVEFMETPGHTKGTISFFFNTVENGKIYRVGMFGGAGANTMQKERFDFEGCREAYRNSLHRLMKEKVDVFIGNHTWNNDTFNKAKVLKETGVNLFIDDKLFIKFLTFCESRLDEVIKADSN